MSATTSPNTAFHHSRVGRRSIQISGEVGVGKPNPSAFEMILDKLGVRAAEAVMVGDSWERDIQGALEVGMQAVWVANGRIRAGNGSTVESIDGIVGLRLSRTGRGARRPV
jgi:FMN phosphatase YigB (HAD superfamily)